MNNYSGNRFNLRSKPSNSIKRVESISYVLGALGDFLVTTWGGLIAAAAVMGAGIIFIFAVFNNSPKANIASNIVPFLLIGAGIILLAINVALTNPVQGSQFKVSTKFLWKKIQNFEAKPRKVLRPFKFWSKDESQSIIEAHLRSGVKVRSWYIAAYSVRGVVSAVAFNSELEEAAKADADLLINSERDTVLTTTIAIDKTNVQKKPLPKNATPAMKRKRDLQYSITSKSDDNQQIKTMVTIATPTPELLAQRTTIFESACHRGLVVGYKRLRGNEIKESFQDIFGEGNF